MEGYKVERRGKKKKRKRKAPPPSKFANAYYDTTSPAAFTGSARRLAKEVEGATERQAREWLRGQDTYTLHKQARRRFSHESIYLEGLDYQWSADLLDVQAHAHENDGVRYLLTVIDGLSKHAWVRPLMNKSAATVAIALEDVFVSSGRQPRRLRTDKGTEFLGQPVQKNAEQTGSGVFYGATLHQGLSVGTVQSHAEGEAFSLFHGHQRAQIPTRVGGLGTRLQSHRPHHHENETRGRERS